MKNNTITVAAIAMAYSLCNCGRAATVVIGASRDATIFENNVDNGSGGGNTLISGTNGAGQSPRRALIAFDIAGNVPAGSIIQSAQLTLVLGQFPNVGAVATGTIGLHRLVADWGEGTTQQQIPPNDTFGGLGQGAPATDGDVTWNARFFSATTPTLWTAPGGDFDPAVSASAVVSRNLDTGYSWDSTAALVSDVQGWLDNPSTNFGWLMVNADEITKATFRGFYSRQVATAAFRPQLSFTYVLAADFDQSDDVDLLDLGNWKSGFGATGAATHAQGDADVDGDVDGADLLQWQRQLGIMTLGTAAATTAPEPSGLALVCFALPLAMAVRRNFAVRSVCDPASALRNAY